MQRYIQLVEDYFMWLASMLSNNETLRRSDAKTELYSLGLSEA